MKKLLTPLQVLVLVLAACSSNKESSSLDSVAVKVDTVVTVASDTVVDVPKAFQEANEPANSDTSELGKFFDEINNDFETKKEEYYSATVSISQYEGSSDVTWYFDKDFSPVYYQESWAMEGNEGTTEYFITGGKVVMCAHTQTTYTDEKWCSSMGGTQISTDSGEPVNAALPDDYGKDLNTSLQRAFENLLQLLNQCEITEKGDTEYTLRMETTVDVGQEVTETAEIHIPKAVYKELVGE